MDAAIKRYVLAAAIVQFKQILSPKSAYEAWLDRFFNTQCFDDSKDIKKATKHVQRRIAQTTLVDNAIDKVYAHKS